MWPPLFPCSCFPLDKTDAVEKCTFGKPGSKESRKRRRKKEKALSRIEVEKFAKQQARSPITTAPTATPCVTETEDLEEEAVPTLDEKLRPNDLTDCVHAKVTGTKIAAKKRQQQYSSDYDSAGRVMG